MLPLPARPPTPSVASLNRDCGNDGEDELATYWTFYWAVAAAQLERWLPRRSARVLDISGGRTHSAAQAAAAGHTVLEVVGPGAAASPVHRSVRRVVADPASLGFLADGCVDAVIAEDRVLSRQLVTETTIAEIARVLRPGGRVLLCVDSLTLGMAILAEQKFWAHLSDVPSAEVVLVPWPDGVITRCFWTDQLREVLSDVGLEVEWIRPRTVLSPSTIEHVLAEDPRALPHLVSTELSAPVHDDSLGIHLLASACRT
ncbi:class I SAM-dependent methyltransferase [Actinomadura craniellae]|uniref:class I SAM-dependent methyltransferase n=1 Tax=Actinomadura craniellae TaxID=2231787 RepID=UPI0026D412B8